MKPDVRRVVVIGGWALASLLMLIAGVQLYEAYQREHNIWWQPASAIRASLLQETSIGAQESEVRDWLEERGVSLTMHTHHIAAGSDYPPTAVGGEAWGTVVLDRHGVLFETAVEVFYIFGRDGRLVDIGVRKTTDAL